MSDEPLAQRARARARRRAFRAGAPPGGGACATAGSPPAPTARTSAWAHLAQLEAHRASARPRPEPFAVYLALATRPDVDLYRRFEDAGVTDLVCAPWMFAAPPGAAPTEQDLATRIGACEWFADKIVSKLSS